MDDNGVSEKQTFHGKCKIIDAPSFSGELLLIYYIISSNIVSPFINLTTKVWLLFYCNC